MANPYAPPRAAVLDVLDPHGPVVPADRGTRLGAAILDGFIFMGMVYLPFIIAAFAGGAAAGVAGDGSGAAMLVGGTALALVGFVAWCWLSIKYVRLNGQSIAKKLVGIKVIRTDGSPISLGRLFWLRNVVNSLIAIVPLYGILDALFIFGESRQCLHDRLADTIVIKA